MTVWGVGYKVSPARDAAPAASRRTLVLSHVPVVALPAAGALPCGIVARRVRLGGDRAAALPELLARPVAPASCAARRRGSTQLYAQQALVPSDEGRPRPPSRREARERDRRPHLLRRRSAFPGEDSGLQPPPGGACSTARDRERRRSVTFEFTPPGSDRPFLAVGSRAPRAASDVRRARRREAADRAPRPVADAHEVPRGLAPRRPRRRRALARYLSRRITRPVLGLSRAADEIAAGNYDVECRSCGAATRSGTSRTGSARWRHGSPRPRSSSATS